MSCSFSFPKNYNVPSGVKDGAEFSDIATFKIDGDKVHILTIGEDKTPIEAKGDKAEKPKGAKQAVKEQLAAMEDKKGSAEMEDSGEDYKEGEMEE